MTSILCCGLLLVVLVTIQPGEAGLGTSTSVTDMVFVCETANGDYNVQGTRGEITFITSFLFRANLSLVQVGLVVVQNDSSTEEIDLALNTDRRDLYLSIKNDIPKQDSYNSDIDGGLSKAKGMIDDHGRSEAEKHIVVVTRGQDLDSEIEAKVTAVATTIKNSGIRISVVYAPEGLESDFYKGLASVDSVDYVHFWDWADKIPALKDDTWGEA